MEKNSNIEIFQLHYYLENQKHSMDALIYNKVETELLKIVGEVSRILDLEIQIEIQALEEGGIKSIYKFLNRKKNRKKVIIIGAFFSTIIGNIISNVIAEKIKSNPEMEQLKKEKIELEIKKLKKELSNDQELFNKNEFDELIIDQDFVDSLSVYITELNKIKISKSKFYKFLLEEGKIEKVSTQELDEKFKPKSPEKIVERKDFKLFILKETEIDPLYEENIELEIISPVLKRTKMNWRALYNGEKISFSMKDINFKNLVINKNLQFSNGTKIICDLETKRKMDEDGIILKSGQSVYSVTQIIYPDGDIIDL